ncbi:MAG TPA: DNA polymerase/3'-5' exonuclease PolX [Noviherbaspirillum sp.]|uniref:DNA polymerase/3'-5' exonuclease PolX n=1 Tax=Noviherbaspirillum sp. TaxID=1926288 RepID=UPI002B48D35C|nr:DNA polymerase/3'-5' exonuclease PolX [Noviherbaspirillum sp.]HJV84386.1 DNA polymerase/3'-5' exonuclease PolX [Noviherbaspirillum sp.]
MKHPVLIHNADVAAIFQQIADLLEIEGDNPFRIRAYRNAARMLSTLAPSVQTMVEESRDLKELPGIGPDLAAKIIEIVATGTCALREELRNEMPPAIHELLTVPGLGPRRVKTLYDERNIQTLDQLAKAARDGEISTIPGFGKRTEQRILEAVQAKLSKARRFRIDTAAQIAESLVPYLREGGDVNQIEVAGSYRRRQETVGDLDIVASSARPVRLLERFVAFGDVANVQSHGTTRASVVLRQGIQIDARAVADKSFGAALHYFTGSKAHNIAVRRLAQSRGLKLNEYGLFSNERRIAGDTEASVFKAVGLPFIEPELRENRGEIEAAQAGHLPTLVQLSDLKGDLHAHTRASDGRNSLKEMALDAQRRGFAYLAITDHSQRLKIAHGLDSTALSKQIDEIDRLNDELNGITLLKGIEVDINEDGSLDMPDAVLARLDIVVGAVHGKFGLPREKQTERILRAMDHPCFTILAHPTGRMIFERDAYDVDILRIIRHAKERGCFLELNAQPERLDMTDTWCMAARREGVLVSIGSDAHSTFDFDDLRFGIGQARRGWLEKKDVLNTRTLRELKAILSRSRLTVAST